MSLRCGRRGLGLIETVVAIFVLIAAMMILFGLFHRSLGLVNRIERRQLAATIAQRKLEEIKAWSRRRAGAYNFDDWSLYAGASGPDPLNPGFVTTVEVVDHPIYSASTSFESIESEPKNLDESTKKVKVTVSYEGGTLSLVTLICDPPREVKTPGPIAVSVVGPNTSPLPPGATISFTAELLDANGAPIRDVFFAWELDSSNGDGQWWSNRAGSLATFKNETSGDTGPEYLGGSIRMVAICLYRGTEYVGFGPDITLGAGP